MKTLKTMHEYERALKTGHPETVIIFYSSWCPDCHRLEPYLDRLEAVFEDIDFYYVQRENHPVLANHLNIYGVPSVLYYVKEDLKETYIDPFYKSAGMITHFIAEARQGRNAGARLQTKVH